MSDAPAILVIRHGALGDMVLSTGPFAAIRRDHYDSHITLLSTRPYAAMLKDSPYFDEIWIDEKPKLWNLPGMWRLFRRLNSIKWGRVYDLQTSRRSTSYFRFLRPCPEWSGIASGASHFHGHPERTRMHTLDRQRDQLQVAGIEDVLPPDVDWMQADVSRFSLMPPYALIVPGGSAHRPAKRWPVEHYKALCGELASRGITPVLLGGKAEEEVLMALEAAAGTRNLGSQTSFAEIVALAKNAIFAIGNDTGPMHLIAAAGCPSVILFSEASDPALCAPRGPHVTILRRPSLADLPVAEVLAAVTSG